MPLTGTIKVKTEIWGKNIYPSLVVCVDMILIMAAEEDNKVHKLIFDRKQTHGKTKTSFFFMLSILDGALDSSTRILVKWLLFLCLQLLSKLQNLVVKVLCLFADGFCSSYKWNKRTNDLRNSWFFFFFLGGGSWKWHL